ncbi:hypothetical protein Tco_0449460 [Tanacetum coccineum]
MSQDFYNSNSFGFDQYQPPQSSDIHPRPQETNKEILQAREDLMEAIQAFLKEYDHIPPNEKCMALLLAEERFLKIKQAMEEEQNQLENLFPIPSELEGISDDTCDVPVGKDSSTFDALSDHSEILSDSNNDGTSSDDDLMRTSSTLKHHLSIWRSLARGSRLITNIESLKDNPTPDHVFKSSSSFPIPVTDSDSFFEKSDTSLSYSDNSLPEFEPFSDDTEETRSGLTSVVISNNSNEPLLELPEFESFHFNLYPSFTRPPPEPPDVEIYLNFEPDAPVINNFDELNEDECFDLGGGEIVVSQNVEEDDSFTFVIRTFLLFLTYLVDSPLLLSTGSEDTIFDPGIST